MTEQEQFDKLRLVLVEALATAGRRGASSGVLFSAVAATYATLLLALESPEAQASAREYTDSQVREYLDEKEEWVQSSGGDMLNHLPIAEKGTLTADM